MNQKHLRQKQKWTNQHGLTTAIILTLFLISSCDSQENNFQSEGDGQGLKTNGYGRTFYSMEDVLGMYPNITPSVKILKNVPLYSQLEPEHNDNLCWATSASMVISYFNNEKNNNRTIEIAKEYWQSDTSYNKTLTVDKSVGPIVEEYCNIKSRGYKATLKEGSTVRDRQYNYKRLYYDTLTKYIDRKYPIEIGLPCALSPTGGAHAVVVVGYVEFGENIHYVVINDPWDKEQFLIPEKDFNTTNYTVFFEEGKDPVPPPPPTGNTSKDTATALQPAPAPVVVTDYIDADTAQFFKILAPGGQFTYTIETFGETDTVGKLYKKGDDTPLVSEDDGGEKNNFRISYDLEPGKEYYVSVEHKNKQGVGEFGISVTMSERITPNTSRDTATEIYSNSTEKDYIDAGTVQYFKFVAPKNSHYIIRTLHETDTVGKLYAQDGVTLLASNDDNEDDINFMIDYPFEKEKTYYILVSHKDPQNGVGEFEIEVEEHKQDVEENPNTSFDAAQHLTFNRQRNDYIDPGTIQYFKLQFPRSGIFTCGTYGPTDTVGELYDYINRDLIEKDDDGGTDKNFRIYIETEGREDYYIAVKHKNEASAGKFAIYCDDVNFASDMPENDYPEAPITLDPDDNTSVIDYIDVNSTQYFQFTPKKDARYIIETFGPTNTYGELFSGNDLESPFISDNDSGTNNNFMIDVNLFKDITYYIDVTHNDLDNGSGDFDINVYQYPF